jgi:hypothetical protein
MSLIVGTLDDHRVFSRDQIISLYVDRQLRTPQFVFDAPEGAMFDISNFDVMTLPGSSSRVSLASSIPQGRAMSRRRGGERSDPGMAFNQNFPEAPASPPTHQLRCDHAGPTSPPTAARRGGSPCSG